MWDNPRLLNASAGFLVGIVLLACAAVGLHLLARSAAFPLRTVELRTPLAHASRAEVEAALARHGRGGFFGAPIQELRHALEGVPWVRHAAVRRVWPDRLVVELEEHVALARWADAALINTYGERFAAASDAPLPLFVGPAGTEAELARRYLRFSRMVAALGPIERVALSPSRAWQLRLASGLQLALGRDADAAEARLGRFMRVLREMPDLASARAVDLRYPAGFAVRAKNDNHKTPG